MEEQQPQSTLSKHERRELEREQQRHADQRQARRKSLRSWIIVILVIVGGGSALLSWLARSGSDSSGGGVFNPARVCINERIPLAMHIHPKLRIVIDGKEERIPVNIGVVGSCVRPVHTHDGSGEIHVESNVVRDFTLSEFFAVWGKTFTTTQILDSKVDDTHRIVLTIGGKESSEFEKLVLRDNEEVEIRYEKKE